jgi:predicted hydrolase (HD superfamily)
MSSYILDLGRTQFGDAKNAGRLMGIEEAHELLHQWVGNERLRLHMKQVAALMKAWALEREGQDEVGSRAWELAGLLHDADWEKYPASHCKMIIEELERRAMDPAVIRCIACHGPKYFGVEPETMMEKMIYVFDELSGFIHAVALIRPAGYEGMDTKSVLKKLKTLSFAAQVNREDISDAINRVDHSLEEIIEFILNHQKYIG